MGASGAKLNNMKITAIELRKDEFDQIFKYLTDRFDVERANERKGHTINVDMCEIQVKDDDLGILYNPFIDALDVDLCAQLELFTDGEYDSDVNSYTITDRSAKFRLTFFYDGEEIKVNDNDLDDRICEYYRI